MGGISRAGNERLRSLLVEGAMSVPRDEGPRAWITAVETRGSKLATPWLLAMLARRPKKVVAVAPAPRPPPPAFAGTSFAGTSFAGTSFAGAGY